MPAPTPDDKRGRLFSAWCDGSLDGPELERLEERLRVDPEFRDSFLNYMDLHAVLVTEGLPEVESPVSARPFGGRPRLGLRSWRRWATAAVVLLLVGLASRPWTAGRRDGQALDGPRTPEPAPLLASPVRFAMVIQLDDIEWEAGSSHRPSEGEILEAGPLALRSGRVTLGLLSGVTLTVEGPADLDLVAIDRVHCRRGKLRTHVPEGAEGFVVSTPGSAVVDLGTEFGLNVASDGTAQMMVFEGEVEAAVLNASGTPLRSHKVVEGHAIELDPRSGRIEEAAPVTEDFVLPTVLVTPPLPLKPSYRHAVLEAGPWAYWRFEAFDDGAFPNELFGRPPLRVTGPSGMAEAGPGNGCVEFGADEGEQRLEMDGLWEPPSESGYAVEFWVSSERLGQAAMVSLIEPGPPLDDYKHMVLLEMTTGDRQSLVPPASVRFLHRWPAADSGGDNLFSAGYCLPYRWHHLVAQASGGQMKLYVDGEPSPPVSLRSALATEACRLVLGRLKPRPRLPGRVHSRPFVGRIDEVALYNRPLTDAEVRRHHELGAPSGRPSRP